MDALNNKNKNCDNNEREFIAKDEYLGDATSFLEEKLEENGVSFKIITQLSVVLEEIFVNVAHYAYKDKDGTFILNISVKDGNITIVTKDSGVPFNPLEKKDPDITLSIEERDIGGLGIFMVKKTMDDVEYEYKDKMNILTMKKKI